jgi:hypothetical protein
MRRRLLPALSALLLALAASGCLEVKQLFTLNPDGTGKVVLESTVKPFSLDESKPNKKEQANDFVENVINSAVGVDVWKDVSCKVLPDGRVLFKGTAYFKDLNTLNLKEVSVSRYTFSRENGAMVLGVAAGNNDDDGPAEPPRELTEAEIAEEIDSLKQQFQMARGMMSIFLDELNEKTSFKLPGAVTESNGFTREPDGALGIVFNGKRVMEIMDSIMARDSFWREAVLEKAKGVREDKDEEMMRLMFGAGKPRAVVTPGSAPAFNYATETAAARKKYPALLKQFKVEEAREELQMGIDE